jgi:RNA polymerase sigma factor (sigma-70 family)
MSSSERGVSAASDEAIDLPQGQGAQRPDALSALYLRHRQDVVDFVRRKFGAGPPDPEDVAQAVFLQLAAHGRLRQVDNPRSFLLKSAQNLVLDHHRRSARQRSHADDLPPAAREMSDFDAERVVTGKERLQMLVEVLARLPADKRQMVLLNRIHGWTCERIGRHFGVSGEAVQKQIERVLKECLARLDGAEELKSSPFLPRLRDRT